MLTAKIREEECIGCSRCVDACPVDAILGANKFTHTVLIDECIGCKLCLDPCPVDCIDMVPLEEVLSTNVPINKQERAIIAKERHRAKNLRLKKSAQQLLSNYASEEERSELVQHSLKASLMRTKNKFKEEN